MTTATAAPTATTSERARAVDGPRPRRHASVVGCGSGSSPSEGSGFGSAPSSDAPNRQPGGDAYYYHMRRQPARRGLRLHRPVALRPAPPSVHPDRRLAAVVRVRPRHDIGGRTEVVLRPSRVVLRHRRRGHHRVRRHRPRDRRAPGRADGGIPGRRLPEHLDERRARSLREPVPAPGGTRPAVRLPVLEAARHTSHAAARGGAGRGHAGPRRVDPARGPHRHPPGARRPVALAGPIGPGGSRHPGRPHRRRAVGRLQHEPVREADLHQHRARHHAGVGQLRPDVVGALRGILVAPVLAAHPHRPPRRQIGAVGGGAVLRPALHPHPRASPSARRAGPPGSGLRRLPPSPAGGARLLRRDTPVPLGPRRPRHVLRLGGPRRRWRRGAAPPACPGLPLAGDRRRRRRHRPRQLRPDPLPHHLRGVAGAPLGRGARPCLGRPATEGTPCRCGARDTAPPACAGRSHPRTRPTPVG